jgi:hypothetical protein
VRRKCAKCGADLPAGSPAGRCVRCLLELGFDSAEEPAVPTQVVVTEKPDDFVGRYKLLEKVGEGGCGVVYVAEQTAPVRRRVALKVIKLGMDTKQVVARFEAERQALAMMDHPNIAKVHDAGTTETGRPYFVMELVRGIRITEYCDQAQLSTKERLDLFIKVCQKSEIGSLAVSADANWLAIGLVHRDGAYVWDLKTRQEVAHLAAGEAKVRLAFSPSEARATSCPNRPRRRTLYGSGTATRVRRSQNFRYVVFAWGYRFRATGGSWPPPPPKR